MKFAMLGSGSSGNCAYLNIGGHHILVDAGISNRAIGIQLASIGVDIKQIDTVLITHEHIDHVRGVNVFSDRQPQVKIYANNGTWRSGKRHLHRVSPEQQQFFTTHQQFQLDDVSITPFAISHDAADPVGYKLAVDDFTIVVATDLGFVSQGVFEHLMGANALIIESNHDEEMLRKGPYPYFLQERIAGDMGHLANNMTAKVLRHVVGHQTQVVLLTHLSDKNNTPDRAFATNEAALKSAGLRPNRDFILRVAERYEVTPGLGF